MVPSGLIFLVGSSEEDAAADNVTFTASGSCLVEGSVVAELDPAVAGFWGGATDAGVDSEGAAGLEAGVATTLAIDIGSTFSNESAKLLMERLRRYRIRHIISLPKYYAAPIIEKSQARVKKPFKSIK